MNLQYYAERILTGEPVIVKNGYQLRRFLTRTAKSIHACPKRNWKKRSYEQVFQDTEKMIAEFALEQQTGFTRNRKRFNVKDRTTYAFDNTDPTYLFNFDCMHEYRASRLTFWLSSVKTKINNQDICHYIVTFRLKKFEKHYEVLFTRVIDTSHLMKCSRIRKVENGQTLYEFNDEGAAKRGYAALLQKEYA